MVSNSQEPYEILYDTEIRYPPLFQSFFKKLSHFYSFCLSTLPYWKLYAWLFALYNFPSILIRAKDSRKQENNKKQGAPSHKVFTADGKKSVKLHFLSKSLWKQDLSSHAKSGNYDLNGIVVTTGSLRENICELLTFDSNLIVSESLDTCKCNRLRCWSLDFSFPSPFLESYALRPRQQPSNQDQGRYYILLAAVRVSKEELGRELALLQANIKHGIHRSLGKIQTSKGSEISAE